MAALGEFKKLRLRLLLGSFLLAVAVGTPLPSQFSIAAWSEAPEQTSRQADLVEPGPLADSPVVESTQALSPDDQVAS